MKLRQLTSEGIGVFRQYVFQLRGDGKLPPPLWMLDDGKMSEPIADCTVSAKTFCNRRAAAEYLDQLFQHAKLTASEQTPGLWSWLTLFFFDQVCPQNSDGLRSPLKEIFRYIPAQDNYQKYYRHFLLGPYLIHQRYKQDVDNAMGLLGNSLHKTDDVYEQVMGKLEWFSNAAVVTVATKLYFSDGKYKKGFQGKGPGSPRRYYSVLDQFDLTYDLFGMSSDSLVELLPKEFNKYLA